MNKFINFYNLLEVGDILVFRNKKNLFSKMIEFFSETSDDKKTDDVSHVVLYINGQNDAVAEYKYPGGFHLTSLIKYIDDKYIIIALRYSNNLTAEQKNNLKNGINSEYLLLPVSEKKYDFISFFPLGLQKIKNMLGLKINEQKDNLMHKKGKFCTDAVDDWYKKHLNIDLFEKEGDKQIAPREFLNNKKLKTVARLEI